MKRTNYGGDPATYQQPYTPWKDQSNREFYYAPGEPGLTGAAKKAPPVPQEVYTFLKNLEDPGSGGEQIGEFFVAYEVFTDVCWEGLDKSQDMKKLAEETIDNLMVDQGVSGKIHASGWLHGGEFGKDDVVYAVWWIPQDAVVEGRLVHAEDTLYQSLPGDQFPAPQGGSDLIQDTNFTPRQYPRPVSFRDRRRRLDYKKGGYSPSGLPEPPPTQTVQNDAMTYPIGGGLLFAAEDPRKMSWFFGAPEKGQSYPSGKGQLHSFVSMLYGDEADANPLLRLTFYLKQVGNRLTLAENEYDLSYFDQAEGESRFGVADLSRLGNDVEDAIFAQLPKDVIQQAKETIVPPSPEEQAKREEKKAKESEKQAKAEEKQVKLEEKKAKIEERKVKTAEREQKMADKQAKAEEKAAKEAQKSTAPLPQEMLGPDAKPADRSTEFYKAEGLSEEEIAALTELKTSDPEAYQSWVKEMEKAYPAQAPDPAAELYKAEGLSEEEIKDLEELKVSDPEAYNAWLKEAQGTKPAGEEADKGKGKTEKNEPQKGASYNVLQDPTLAELAPDMTPEEKLFTNIKRWDGDTFYANPDKLDSQTLELLKKKKKGEGKYFSWSYRDRDDVKKETGGEGDQEPVLTINRLGPWTDIQPDVVRKRNELLEGKK